MKNIVNIHEAKTQLSKLLSRVEKGEKIIIANRGKPVAFFKPLYRIIPKSTYPRKIKREIYRA